MFIDSQAPLGSPMDVTDTGHKGEGKKEEIDGTPDLGSGFF
jgi:hypothetical protein